MGGFEHLPFGEAQPPIMGNNALPAFYLLFWGTYEMFTSETSCLIFDSPPSSFYQAYVWKKFHVAKTKCPSPWMASYSEVQVLTEPTEGMEPP